MVLFLAERGLPLAEVLACAILWEGLLRLFDIWISRFVARPGVALDGALAPKLRRDGASYLVSLAHSVVVTARGLGHLAALAGAPVAAQFFPNATDPADPWCAAGLAVEARRVSFRRRRRRRVVVLVFARGGGPGDREPSRRRLGASRTRSPPRRARRAIARRRG